MNGIQLMELQHHENLDCLLFSSQLGDSDTRRLQDTAGNRSSHPDRRSLVDMIPNCDLEGTNIVCLEGMYKML